MSSFSIRYIYSACVVISIDRHRILCDPWFTDGIYGGSWFQYPPIPNPIERIGDVDFIYISHLHPDHYDSSFLQKYFDHYGPRPIFISDRSLAKNFLGFKIKSDLGIDPIIDSVVSIEQFKLYFLESESFSPLSIDSALLIVDQSSKLALLNLNDCVYSDYLASSIKNILSDNIILRLALFPYSGANSFPHTYLNYSLPIIQDLSFRKAANNLMRMKKFLDHLNPDFFIPFAGKYFLGSSASFISMNRYRGIPDPVSFSHAFTNCIVPDDSGFSGFDLLQSKVIGSQRTAPYCYSEVEDYLTRLLSDDASSAVKTGLEIPQLLSLLQHRLSVLIGKGSILPPSFDVVFGIVASRTLFLSSEEIAKGFSLSSLSVNPTQDNTSMSIQEFDFHAFVKMEYAFVLESSILSSILSRCLNWNEASIGSHIINFRNREFDRDFEHSLALL